MGFHRYAAEHVGRRGRCHQERHDGDYSGAAGGIRRQRGAGDDSVLPRRAQAYAVVLNGAPARRDDVESPIVTIARESLAKFWAPVWAGQITNRADLLMALSHGEGAREYYAEGRAAAEIGRLWAAIERSVKAIRGSAPASSAMHKQAA